ncbi:MAG: hypothetical protein WBG41_09080 [Acidimicrobiales bacterium]
MSPIPGTGRLEQFAQAVAERVVALVVEAVDVDAILDRIDVDRLMARIDVDQVVQRVDVERLIARVDVQRIIERVDVEQIIERVDVEQIIERVDVKRLMEQVDVEAIVSQTEIGTIIAHSTSGVASEVLDIVRAQGVGLDDFVSRWVNRALRRSSDDLPVGPPALVGKRPTPALASVSGNGHGLAEGG